MSMTKIPTLGMRREDWLEERRKSIGGSDAAGILGLNRYSSPFILWLDKTGQLPEKEETEAMRIGRDLEDYVAKRWSEATGKKVRRENHLIRNSLYPFAHADVDRMVVSENAGLECKTTSTLDLRQFHGVEFPEPSVCDLFRPAQQGNAGASPDVLQGQRNGCPRLGCRKEASL